MIMGRCQYPRSPSKGKAFAAAGVTLFKRLSLGVQWNYYFGKLDKVYSTEFNDASYNGILNGTTTNVTGNSFKFGVQYEQPIGTKHALTVGATYSLPVKLTGSIESYRFSSGTAVSDTLSYRMDYLGQDSKVQIPSEIAVGISFQERGQLSCSTPSLVSWPYLSDKVVG